MRVTVRASRRGSRAARFRTHGLFSPPFSAPGPNCTDQLRAMGNRSDPAATEHRSMRRHKLLSTDGYGGRDFSRRRKSRVNGMVDRDAQARFDGERVGGARPSGEHSLALLWCYRKHFLVSTTLNDGRVPGPESIRLCCSLQRCGPRLDQPRKNSILTPATSMMSWSLSAWAWVPICCPLIVGKLPSPPST